MPSMSSTPRAPTTALPMIRPTAVALLTSVFAGKVQSLSTSARGKVTVTVCTQGYIGVKIAIYTYHVINQVGQCV